MAQYSQRTQPMHRSMPRPKTFGKSSRKKLHACGRNNAEKGRRNKWLEVIGRPDLLDKTDIKPHSYKVCSAHFENSMMSRVLLRKLLPGAVPTKLLSTKSQPSTSTYVMESQSSEMSTQAKHVESSAASSVHYKPTLWYYKHLNFLSGNKDPDSDDSDSDHNDDTVYVQLPRAEKRAATTSIAQERESDASIDASAAAFGRSVGAQLHHLSKMQRCIAEKLISDVIYHAKMELLSLDTSIDVKETAGDQVNILIPKAGPSWYDTDTAIDTGGQESSSSCKLIDTPEDLVRKEIAETESAVNFIKMERDETENYCFQDDEDEQTHAIDIIKEELL